MKNPERSEMHGALILTPNRELALQIYSEIRKLDPKNRLKVSRLGSVSHITPHIEFLVNL